MIDYLFLIEFKGIWIKFDYKKEKWIDFNQNQISVMDDIPMADDSPGATPQQQRFNIVDVLGVGGEGSRSSNDSTLPLNDLNLRSDMIEVDEHTVYERLKKLYPYVNLKVIFYLIFKAYNCKFLATSLA